MYDQFSQFNINGKLYNVFDEIVKIRSNYEKGLTNEGEIYDYIFNALGEEVLFSEGLGETLKNCRGILIITINEVPLNEASELNKSDSKHKNTFIKLNIAIAAKALGHEVKAHANSLMTGKEVSVGRQHELFQGVPSEGIIIEGSLADQFNKEIDSIINKPK